MESVQEIINATYFNNTIWQYLLFFGSVILAIIAGKIFYYYCQNKLRKFAEKSAI